MSPLYLDLLDKERRKIFKKLKNFSPQFVLAGGTALMLQIAHRLSFDFDCFTQKTITVHLLKKIENVLGKPKKIEVQTSEILLIKTLNNVEITFVSHPFKPLKEEVKTPHISLFHLDDLAANKAYTIGRRAVWRDYVDLFFLLKWKIYNLERIIRLAQKKFDWMFSDKMFLQQLSYFEDVKIVKTHFVKEVYSPQEIKTFLEKEVRSYLQKILPK